MKPFAVFALALCITPLAHAQHQTFAVNPDASVVKMTLNTTHEIVTGNFHLKSGSIDFDRSTSKIAGSVIVLALGNTGSGMRDKKMNNDILLVPKFAEVSFEPKSYTGALAATGDSTLQVTGIFTLIGRPHEITIPMLVHLDGSTATAKAHFVVPYVQWGLKNPSFMIWKAENDVTIDLALSGTVTK